MRRRYINFLLTYFHNSSKKAHVTKYSIQPVVCPVSSNWPAATPTGHFLSGPSCFSQTALWRCHCASVYAKFNLSVCLPNNLANCSPKPMAVNKNVYFTLLYTTATSPVHRRLTKAGYPKRAHYPYSSFGTCLPIRYTPRIARMCTTLITMKCEQGLRIL